MTFVIIIQIVLGPLRSIDVTKHLKSSGSLNAASNDVKYILL